MSKAQKCYLRIGSDALEQAEFCGSIGDALAEFGEVARELDRYGQSIDASIHFVDRRNDPELTEYPDRVLSLGPRGGIKMEAC
jgi:hypothetical protein